MGRKDPGAVDKAKLREMAQDKRFIRGIYNYCDRWCERCPQTSLCLNYAMAEEEIADPETRDIHNEAFWKKLAEIFRDTLEMLKERAASEGIDLDDFDSEEYEEENRSVQEAARNHEISRAARAYSGMAENWFDGARAFFGDGEETDPGCQPLSGKEEDPEKSGLEEALEVVRWYQHQIYVKLVRAISGLVEEESEVCDELDQLARDSDGSAKVALIGIDRSIAAWGIIGGQLPSFRSHDVPAILTHLERLRRRIEMDFPDARGFLRPGFDRIDLNS
ncbi:hypothetical protein ACFL9T_21735 [Thermodesulfobacteriota bacterium]